jgi:hypothetical protein
MPTHHLDALLLTIQSGAKGPCSKFQTATVSPGKAGRLPISIMMFAPLEGWRRVKVTDRHAAVDFAQMLKELSEVDFPDAVQIQLVQDNLSTHTAASLYAAFPTAEARPLVAVRMAASAASMMQRRSPDS